MASMSLLASIAMSWSSWNIAYQRIKALTIVDLPTCRDHRLILNLYLRKRLIASSWNGYVFISWVPSSFVLI